jgi:membrane-bound lytic murein transglycosylase F
MIKRLILATSATFCALLAGCAEQGDSLEQIKARGELQVATRNSPTTYFTGREGPTGFEFDLAELLAQELDVELRLTTAFTLDGLFELLRRGEVDLAAAGLTLTDERALAFPYTAPYFELEPQVVYVAGKRRPRAVKDLLGRKVAVLAGSSHAEFLRGMQQTDYPELSWQEVDSADTMELLEMLDTGAAELAIIDSNEFAVQQTLYPRLKVGFELGVEQDMVWYLPPERDNTRLQEVINALLERLDRDGSLAELREQHFGHTKGFSRISSHTFNLKMRNTFPQYEALIKQVAKEYQLEWQLLAAIAYQESHWDPEATSPTGVRGMMMLTRPTAKELGVSNRLDPLQSLRGGARYLKNMKRRLPKGILEPDRTSFALAAYNIGLGHLEDARVITQRQGGDPNSWQDVAERLPLLQKSSHYKNTRYGYARGVEAATYVKNIRYYRNILDWQDISDSKPLPPMKVEEYLPAMLRESKLWAL